jgi:ABC-type bacteriocin/lantibiotic exporter with double-glycine peptidase domain
MSGTRLGLILETLSTFAFGLVLGAWFSWQLTLMVFIFVSILLIVAILDIRIHARVSDAASLFSRQASSVRTGHFLRTCLWNLLFSSNMLF